VFGLGSCFVELEDSQSPARCFYTLFLSCLLEKESALVFGLTWKSKYKELEKQRDEMKAYMSILTGEVGNLRKEVAELKKDTQVSKRRIWQLQQETNNLRIQKDGLADHVEILTKEREIFQRTIESLCQVTKKRKQTSSA
jgi:chromosome segregation ATPase